MVIIANLTKHPPKFLKIIFYLHANKCKSGVYPTDTPLIQNPKNFYSDFSTSSRNLQVRSVEAISSFSRLVWMSCI